MYRFFRVPARDPTLDRGAKIQQPGGALQTNVTPLIRTLYFNVSATLHRLGFDFNYKINMLF